MAAPKLKSALADDGTRTSHSLILRAKNNDTEAWERLVKLYSPLVYYWCKDSGLPDSDVNDIFQDVFHTLARNLSKFRPIQNGTFRGWLRTLTRNRVADHYRKTGREPRPIGGTEAFNYFKLIPDAAATGSAMGPEKPGRAETEIQHSILRQALANIRGSFAEQTWNAFWMVVIDGRETSDVAKDLCMKSGTVRVAKSRVLKRLRLEIGDAVE